MLENLLQTAILAHFTSLRTLVLRDTISISLETQVLGTPSPGILLSICSLLPTFACPHLHQITFELELDPSPEHGGFTVLPSLSIWEIIDSNLSQERFPSLHRVIFEFGVWRMNYVVDDLSDTAEDEPSRRRRRVFLQCPSWEEAVPLAMQCLPRLVARNCLRFEPLR